MELVKFVDEIKENMQTLDGYLDKKCDPEYSYALDLIKRGKCFIVAKKENGYGFYPSRFIGYIENTMGKHENSEKDGRETNRAISLVLNKKLSVQIKFEEEYMKYCKELGIIKIYNYKRRYWEI